MKTRYFFYAAAIGFFAAAVAKVMHPQNLYAAGLDTVAGVIFLALAIFPRAPKSKPGP